MRIRAAPNEPNHAGDGSETGEAHSQPVLAERLCAEHGGRLWGWNAERGVERTAGVGKNAVLHPGGRGVLQARERRIRPHSVREVHGLRGVSRLSFIVLNYLEKKKA